MVSVMKQHTDEKKAMEKPKYAKPMDRGSALIMPRKELTRLQDYAMESERAKLQAEKETRRLAAQKKATLEATKDWANSPENVKKRREEERLARQAKEQQDREQLEKDRKARAAEEQAKVIAEARKLLFYRKPYCRMINRALLVAECLREREKQIEFNRHVRELDRKVEDDYLKRMMRDVEDFWEKENEKKGLRVAKRREWCEGIKSQIEEREIRRREREKSELSQGMQELQSISKELETLQQQQSQAVLAQKKKLKESFMSEIELKHKRESQERGDERYQEKALDVFRTAKENMSKMTKQKIKDLREQRTKKIEELAGKYFETIEKSSKEIDEFIESEAERRERLMREEDEKKKQSTRENRQKAKLEFQQGLQRIQEEAEKRKTAEAEMKKWELLQKLKRHEFDKEWNAKARQREIENKKKYRQLLQIQAKERAAKSHNELFDDSCLVKKMIENSNKCFLDYAQQILKESEAIRPTYPIIKAITQFQKEANLLHLTKDCEEPCTNPPRHTRMKRMYV